ncbi:hypothetical protein I350_02852 [Cryptococcus amylolentus CBS 6273]|uniref:Uncharacterized protein n=1 Tax=Cryptococcus amylolentus CBS 6273 TaxID=1296118 RepID=A0A1E3KAF1_9TREE|nr:hypothetical protein I350_02852 [Cryptococcus amylolentus CBS 6273]
MSVGSTIDLSSVPIAFLEAYPFPALALLIESPLRTRPRLVSRDTDSTVRQLDEDEDYPDGSSSTPYRAGRIVWGNAQWKRLAPGEIIGDCLSPLDQNRLQAWIESAEHGEKAETLAVDIKTAKGTTLYLTKTILPPSPSNDRRSLCILTSHIHDPPGVVAPSVSSSIDRASPGLLEPSSPFPRSLSFSSSGSRPVDAPIVDTRSSTTSATNLRSSVDSTSPDAQSPSQTPIRTHTPFGKTLSIQDDRKSRKRSPRGTTPSIKSGTMESQAAERWRLVESFDWAKTPMGPREQWMDALDPVLAITFESRTQDCAWLGPDLRLVYNLPYQELINHPAAWGQPASEVWAGNWDYLEPLAKKCLSGTPIYKDNDAIFWRRYGNGVLLEHYHTWRYVPITGKDGSIMGIFNQSMETTDTILMERRLNTTRELSEQMTFARTLEDYFDTVADVLGQNPADMPFALCYRVHQKDADALTITLECDIQVTVGVPDDHPSAPQSVPVNIRSQTTYGVSPSRPASPTASMMSAQSANNNRVCHIADQSQSWPLEKAISTRQCVFVEDCSRMITGFPIRQWNEPPTSAIVVPICSEGSHDVPGSVMIFGINIRRPFDPEYELWMNSLRALLASSFIAVKSHEAEAKMAEDSAKMEAAKVAWFRGAAHDLRSPLTLIAGPLSDVLESKLEPKQRTALTMAQRNLERLMRLINSLMDFSRVEAGRMEGRFVPTNLSEYVADLAALFKPAAERLGLQFIVEIEPREELVLLDPLLFETIVSNLIGNALKYTESGSIAVRVTYTSGQGEISVTDTGVGIPKDELALVTEWFHRSSTALHSGTQGTGLGLALAKELVKLHGGELHVWSQTAGEAEGTHGSVFSATIPLDFKPQSSSQTQSPYSVEEFGKYGQIVADEAMRWVADADEASEVSDKETGSGGSAASSGNRFAEAFLFDKKDVVLVVEDNVDMRKYIAQLFAPHCTVLQASDGKQAFDMAVKKPPNLILADVLMPKMSGMELLQAIRSHPDTRIVPIVLISAVAGDEPRMEALLNGAEDYMAKPFKPKELLARVHLHLQVGKKRAKLEALYAQRETELAVLSDYCPTGIFRADTKGHIVYSNNAWRTQSGVNDSDPDSWPMYLSQESQHSILELWRAWVLGDEKSLKTSWRWANDTPVRAILVRLEHAKHGFSGFLGCVVDISHEERRLVEAEERRREAEESKHQQELLIDLTSHEIRNPLNAILSCSDLVKQNLITLQEQLRASGLKGFIPSPELLSDLEQDVEALESIHQCGLVQERIAGDILSLARIQLEMLSLHYIEVNLRREARKVSSIFASEAKMKQVDLTLTFGPTIEQSQVLLIKTDPVRLGQVVTNLISNAMRFTAGVDDKKITIQYDVSFVPPAEGSCALPSNIGLPTTLPAPENTPVWLFVSVTDTGPGMSPSELAVLFQRFAQGNKMIHTKYGGSGLGLYICRKITELLGGRIEVLSELGKGSVFRFFIKTRAVSPPTAMAAFVEPTALTPISASTPSSSFSMSRTSSNQTPKKLVSREEDDRILVVEDNLINQTVLKRQLVKAGLSCDVVNNGLEALNTIREANRQYRLGGVDRTRLYDVVLMDLEMPVMDGLTAIKEIRSAEAAGHLERNMVIALTGNARQGQIDQALAEGMDDVVIKPYRIDKLLVKIKGMKAKRSELELNVIEDS